MIYFLFKILLQKQQNVPPNIGQCFWKLYSPQTSNRDSCHSIENRNWWNLYGSYYQDFCSSRVIWASNYYNNKVLKHKRISINVVFSPHRTISTKGLGEKTLTATIIDGAKTTKVQGTYKSKSTPDGTIETIIYLSKTTKTYFAKIIIISQSGGKVTQTEVKDKNGIKCVSTITNEGKEDLIKTTILYKTDQKIEIVTDLQGVKKSSTGEITFKTTEKGIWEVK